MNETQNIDNLMCSLYYEEQSHLFHLIYQGKTLDDIFSSNLLQLNENILQNIKLNILPKVKVVSFYKELSYVKFSDSNSKSPMDGRDLSYIYFFGINGATLKDYNNFSNLY